MKKVKAMTWSSYVKKVESNESKKVINLNKEREKRKNTMSKKEFNRVMRSR